MAHLGPLDDPELYYPKMMVEVLPVGLFGLLIASFLAAFMSTIDTQLHWGASLLINDLYRRFIRPDSTDAHHLLASRIAVLGLAVAGGIASLYIESIAGAWELAFALTAGLGSVYVARWYWWRVSAWSEWTAIVCSVVTYGLLYLGSNCTVVAEPSNGMVQLSLPTLSRPHLSASPYGSRSPCSLHPVTWRTPPRLLPTSAARWTRLGSYRTRY